MPEKTYFPLSSRLIIPVNTTTPRITPYIVEVFPEAEFLGYVEFNIPQDGILQTLGVKIINNNVCIYPAPGSISDLNFQEESPYGAMPPTWRSLKIPFDRRLRGKPSVLRFEYYNVGAAAVHVNVLIATFTETPQKPVSDTRPMDLDKKTIEVKVK